MRKEATVVIDAEGRDKGKIYRLREMSASQAEAWGCRLTIALAKSGVEVPEGFFSMGMAGVAVMGLQAMGGLSWDVAKPLLDEMMGCVQIQPGAAHPSVVRGLIEDDIEEVATRLRLRDEVIKLHTGFSIAVFLSNFQKTQQVRAETAARQMTETGENTETSGTPSAALSPVA